MRFWYWSQPVVAVVLLAITVYSLVDLFLFQGSALTSIQLAVTAWFIFPGLLISLGVNQVALSRRRPRTVTRTERILLGVEYLLMLVLVLTALPSDALVVGLLIWPLLIGLAVAVTITILVTSQRLSGPTKPTERPTEADLDQLGQSD